MIFGDRGELAIEVDRFDAPWGTADAADESVWGAVSIWIAGRNLSEHRRIGTDRMRDELHVPLLPLVRWTLNARDALRYEERSPLGASASPHEALERWSEGPPPPGLSEAEWLDRRDRWWSEHFTGAGAPDVVAPSIGIVRNDDRALVSWRTPALPRPDRSFVLPQGSQVVSWAAVESALDDFAKVVSNWAPPETRFETADASSPRALEYYTGLSEHEIRSFGFLPEAAKDPAVDPLAQVARDLTWRTATGSAHGAIVDGVRAAVRSDAHGWWDLRQQLAASGGQQFESEGYDGAQATRRLLGLDGQPIADVAALLRRMDVDVSTTSPASKADGMVVAGVAEGRAVTMVLANERTAKPWGRRFELARALGHLLLDPVRGEAIGAASGPQGIASRRRRAGAFAAEMLLPSSALEEASDGVLDGVLEGQRFPDLLDRFGVGATTAAFHLWNQRYLSSAEVRDDLIPSN